MRRVVLKDSADVAEWREFARSLLGDGVAPEHVLWENGSQPDLLDLGMAPAGSPSGRPGTARVPAGFLQLAALVVAHADPRRHALLYRLLWRLTHGERFLLEMATDVDVAWAMEAAKAVRREKHKMKAFVRFREVAGPEGAVYIAWFEPVHDVLPQVAPFFQRRFAGMRWSILTPARSAHWDGETLVMGDGADRSDAPDGDALEDLWRVYYANIFNPARLKIDAMVKEMPVRYWKNLPEASLIPGLIREAGGRMQAMVAAAPTVSRKAYPAPERTARTAPPITAGDELRTAILGCRACPLWKPATQAVPGTGPEHASVMVIGEQPGDQEDLSGKPFVGPAGQLFDRALAEVGIDRDSLFLTNAVKHFKFEPRGKRRIHSRANPAEQAACRPWLLAELDRIQPKRVLCLGNVAARALLGPGVSVLSARGRWHRSAHGVHILVTVHPSYLLRLPAAGRAEAWHAFVADLQLLHSAMATGT